MAATGVSVQERILTILDELPSIGKDARNEQQKFMYRSHDQVLNALNPLLALHGVFMVPFVLERLEARRETRSGGVMYEVNLHVKYRFYGPDGDYVEGTAWGEGTDSGDKSTNKAMTMAFKNVIAQVFAISTADTQDSDAHTPEETVRPFDPDTDLMAGAIKGKDAPKRIGEALKGIDPSVDWGNVFDSLEPGWRKLKGAEAADFWRRASNATFMLGEQFAAGSFPPPTAAQIMEPFAWAFGGTLVAVVYLAPDEPALLPADTPLPKADDDVAFGEEAK